MRRINSERILVLAIVALGISLKIWVQTHLKAVSPDGFIYSYYALRLAEGEVSLGRRGPLFQLLLMTSYKIFGASFESSILVPQFFGGIVPILLFFMGKRFFDSKTGLISSLLGSMNLMLVNLSCWVLRETLSLALILMTILVAHATVKTRSKERDLIKNISLGILLGLLFLTRDDYILFVPICIGYIYCQRGRKLRNFTTKTTIILIVTILIISPWLYYSYKHFHTFFPSISTTAMYEEARTGVPLLQFSPEKIIAGLWRELTLLPNIFSLFVFPFIPIGFMFTIKKRVVWIVYFFMSIQLIALSLYSYQYLYYRPLPYEWSGGSRIMFSGVMPATVIAAYGIGRFISFVSDARKIALPSGALSYKKSKRMYLVVICLVIFGFIAYVPPYYLTLKDFDKRTMEPFIKSAEFLNSTPSKDAVFTLHPDLLEGHYKGPVYKLPVEGGFERILEEAEKKGVKYLIIESTSAVCSRELAELYYRSALGLRVGREIPLEFVLVETEPWIYGIYAIRDNKV